MRLFYAWETGYASANHMRKYVRFLLGRALGRGWPLVTWNLILATWRGRESALFALVSLLRLGAPLGAADAATLAPPAAPVAPAAAPVLNEAIPNLPPPPSATAEPHVNTATIPYPQYYDDALLVGRGNIPTFNRLHAANVARAKQGGIDLLFMGDSITQFWASTGRSVWAANFAPLQAANFGVSADRTQNVLWRLQNGEGEGFQPKVVVLMIGTNNLGPEVDNKTPRNSPAEIAAGIAAILQEFRTRFPTAKTLLLGILPREAKGDPDRKDLEEVNRDLAQLDDGRHVFFLDLGPRFLNADGSIKTALMQSDFSRQLGNRNLYVHPKAAGYQVWADAIKEPLSNLLAGKDLYGFPLPDDVKKS